MNKEELTFIERLKLAFKIVLIEDEKLFEELAKK